MYNPGCSNNRIQHFIQKNPLTWATDVAGETFTLQLGCDGLVTISERWCHQMLMMTSYCEIAQYYWIDFTRGDENKEHQK